MTESLYFGSNKPGGAVTAGEWDAFVSREITPRFPHGLTTWQAAGQWQGANGVIERETSHVLTLVHDDTAGSERAIADIIDRYKSDFRQEAVLRIRTRACMSL